MSTKTIELLAPVGSKESFITAVRAGANAVYMGVPGFNARISADNINEYDLQVIIDHAHEKNVKVFLALNTLVKHEEINDVVKSISYINRLRPDAVIVQDLGIASIIAKYYPDLELHASTQMAVHNRMGVDFLARHSFKRAILARELTFSELKAIVKGSPIPIEIFCHGALCFSLSGMCLFSSFIGGLSGNRGRCTQPCRRLWQNGNRQGYLFSPRDLELAAHIQKLKQIGVASLKIEGRMRSSEYVYKTVKAYRMLIDAPESDFAAALAEAGKILSGDAAREKTTALFSGRDEHLFQPLKAQCLGNGIGEITASNNGVLSITLNDESVQIAAGDRLRLSNPATDITISFKIKECAREGLLCTIPFEKADRFAAGNPVFKTIDAAGDQQDISTEIDAMYKAFTAKHGPGLRKSQPLAQTYTSLISNIWKEAKSAGVHAAAKDALWIRFDNADWLTVLPEIPGARYVLYLTKENLHQCRSLQTSGRRFLGELPPFIAQRDIELYKQAIDTMIAAGVTGWVLNNVSHFELFKGRDVALIAGHLLYTWNAYTAAFWAGLGVRYVTVSWEDDFLNIRKMCGPGLGKHLVVYTYGFVPVVRSRFITREMLTAGKVSDRAPANGAHEHALRSAFYPVFESELSLLIPEKPVSIFTGIRKLKEIGVQNFGIDLSYSKTDKKLWQSVFEAYSAGENPVNTVKFNFKSCVA